MQQSAKRIDLLLMVDADVLGRDGNRLGRLEEVIVNIPNGRIEYVTLGVRQAEDRAVRRIRIPWSQFHLAGDKEHFELNISLDTLRSIAMR